MKDAKLEVLIKDVVVPDTSIIVQGTISEKLEADSLEFKRIIIHEAVMAELESQANKGRESGYLGLDEITKIRELADVKKFKLEFLGNRPGDFEIKFAKSGEIDSLIRDLAANQKATLLTADLVQGKVALAKGLSVIIYDVQVEEKTSLAIERFFFDGVMSVHLRVGCVPKVKQGRPGAWDYVDLKEDILLEDAVANISYELIEFAKSDSHSFIESDKKNSTVLQVKDMRVVIVRPPLADAFEITVTRPISRLNFEDYALDESLKKRLLEKAEGLLVAGPPGHGKSTFVQCLADKYLQMNKAVKTLESPRDLCVDKSITRYGSNHANQSEIRDVLLLSRPDFVLFDEVRNFEDFKLFADIRLSGIGMLGVLHASEPIDAIQRFLGRLDLGVIPHVIDTVVFVFEGVIKKVFSLSLSVKVPSGMIEADLARPVIMINDFTSGKLEYEVYSYGDEAIVVPISSINKSKPAFILAAKFIEQEIKKLDVDDVCVEFLSNNKCVVFTQKDDVSKVIGPKGITINELQRKFDLKIDVSEKKATKKINESHNLNFTSHVTSKHIIFDLDNKAQDSLVSIFVDDDFIMSVKSSKKSQIKVNLDSPNGKLLALAEKEKKEIKISLA